MRLAAARRIGRGAHHVMRWLGSIAAVLILAAGFVIWRLMQGPIALDWLAPYVEAGLERSGIGLKVGIAGVSLGIDRTTHHLHLWAQDVRLSLPNGAPLAHFPEMATSFEVGALLRGQLMPAQLIIEHPVVHLARGEAGGITAQVGAPGEAAPDLGPQMIEQLAGPRRRDTPFGLVERLIIRGATVIVDDKQSGHRWQADRVDLAVERSGRGVRGDFSLATPIGTRLAELRAEYRYIAERQILDLDLSIDGVEPAAIPPLIPELAQLQHLQMPIAGTLRTRIDVAQGTAKGSRLDLVLGEGQVQSEFLPKGTLAVEKGELHAAYAPESSEVQIEKFSLDLGDGAELHLAGSLAGITPELIAAARDSPPAGRLGGAFEATLTHVPVARLEELWPQALSWGGRRWVLANVHDGVVDEASAQLSVDLDPVEHTAGFQDAKGTLRYHDLTVTYFDGLPPARKVNGVANFAGRHLQFLPDSGVVKGLKLTGGTLDMTDLGSPVEWLTIDLTASGPIQDAMEILDSKPLHYARAIGLEPAQLGGRVDSQLHFKLPLLADLKLDAVEYGAKATMSGVAIGKVAMERDLTDGNLSLDLGRNGARLEGNARFDGIPSKIDANVSFRPHGGPRAVYRVGLTLDSEARRRFDVDPAPENLSGPVGVDLTYSVLDAVRAQVVAALDLRGASLAITEAGWKKPPDAPATAKIVMELERERVARLPEVEVKAAGLDGRFSIGFASGGGQIEQVEIKHLVAGDNDLTGTVVRRAGGGWNADIRAARLDARPLFKQATKDTGPGSLTPLAITARIDRLQFGPRREIGSVSTELLRNGGLWQSARFDGQLADGHKLTLRLGEGNGRRLSVQSDDLGATLKLLGVADNVVGGRLNIDAQVAGAASGTTLQAHIEGENYGVQRAPIMAQILALPSFTGFLGMLSGSGLPFSTLRGDLDYGGGRVMVKNLLAFGEAVGITANGWVDIDRDRMELAGTVAPAYALNSLLGNIPLLGNLLVGGSQGLFAANYRLSGSSDNPDVSVNPLSVLTPGVLRQLFAPLVGYPAPQSEQQAAH